MPACLTLLIFPGRALVQARRAGEQTRSEGPHPRAHRHARAAQGVLQRPDHAERHGDAHPVQASVPQVPGRRLGDSVKCNVK